ncbi:MAG: hypothetical protein LBH63_05420, partial [Clostridiales Family XIII bacterium]|nr:hypothetical protein [Clostridiales Family XIII bacterium]
MNSKKMQDSGIFAGLTQSEYDDFIAAAKPRSVSLSKDEMLIDEGERASAFWLIESGRLKGA